MLRFICLSQARFEVAAQLADLAVDRGDLRLGLLDLRMFGTIALAQFGELRLEGRTLAQQRLAGVALDEGRHVGGRGRSCGARTLLGRDAACLGVRQLRIYRAELGRRDGFGGAGSARLVFRSAWQQQVSDDAVGPGVTERAPLGIVELAAQIGDFLLQVSLRVGILLQAPAQVVGQQVIGIGVGDVGCEFGVARTE